MKAIARYLIRLYPANWRERYGEEFEALLDDSSPGWSAVFDLLKGAVKMQFNMPSFPKLVCALAIGGMLTGLAISFMVTPRYISQAEMEFNPALQGSTPLNLVERLMQFEQQVLSRTSLSRIIQDPRLDLYRYERAHIPLEDVIEKMRTRDIRIRIDSPGTREGKLAFSVSFVYTDRIKAQQTVQALLTGFMDANLGSAVASQQLKRNSAPDQVDRMEARIAALEKRLGIPPPSPALINQMALVSRTGWNLDVLDPPSLPVKAISPDRFWFTAVGFASGFAASVLIAIFRRKMPPIPFPAQTA
jgi:hypothetical protein